MKTPPADAWGIAPRFRDALGHERETPKRARAKLRAAMRAGRAARPPETEVAVVVVGRGMKLREPRILRLETGETLRVGTRLPGDLPIGTHESLTEDGAPAGWVIVTPGKCPAAPESQQWGWAVQLYAVRSRASWGIGDFEDLRQLGLWSKNQLGAGFLLLNPMGAPLPGTPQEASPYSPSSRLFLNPLYLRVEKVAGWRANDAALGRLAESGRALNARRLIERDAVLRLKMAALKTLWRRFEGDTRFDAFRRERGETLRLFGIFNALAEEHGGGWRGWPSEYQRPDGAAVEAFARKRRDRVEFHQWIQWLLDEQLRRAGRAISLMVDVPIGVRSDGFDAWLWQDEMALGAAVGAPPDEYNTLGQNWGLPPFIPHRLRASGYRPWRETLRAMLRHAGGLRIDHVMGLFRLYWIPEGRSAREGGFVRYNAEEMLAILAIEAQRAGAVVVGEDLGTVEAGARRELARREVLSYRLLWFEERPPERYPEKALAAVTTHDLFTVAGLWSGSDLEAQRRLNLNPNAEGMAAIRRRVGRLAGVGEGRPMAEVLPAVHATLRRAPSRMFTAMLEDGLGVEERPNMPGTVDQWPNWRLGLPKTLEELKRDAGVLAVARVMRSGGGISS